LKEPSISLLIRFSSVKMRKSIHSDTRSCQRKLANALCSS